VQRKPPDFSPGVKVHDINTVPCREATPFRAGSFTIQGKHGNFPGGRVAAHPFCALLFSLEKLVPEILICGEALRYGIHGRETFDGGPSNLVRAIGS
jgi:hypothetical protein